MRSEIMVQRNYDGQTVFRSDEGCVVPRIKRSTLANLLEAFFAAVENGVSPQKNLKS